jgi:hypothetical protein
MPVKYRTAILAETQRKQLRGVSSKEETRLED